MEYVVLIQHEEVEKIFMYIGLLLKKDFNTVIRNGDRSAQCIVIIVHKMAT